MEKTPELYKNPNINPINNNRKIYRINKNEKVNSEDIKSTLDMMFYNLGHTYNKKVHIITNNKEYKTYIIARNKKAIYTSENEEILIDDIIKIEDCSQY